MHTETLLAEYYFERYVLEVAITTLEKGGSASKLNTYQFLPPVDAWGFPKYPGKTVILPSHVNLFEELKTFIQMYRSVLLEADAWLGTWINPSTRQCYLDITTSHEDLDEARKEAIERGKQEGRKVVALYNSKRDQTVYL